MTEDMQPLKVENRLVAIGLAVIAAACLLFACFSHHWLVNISKFGERAFGLHDNSECGDAMTFRAIEISSGEMTSQCVGTSNSEFMALVEEKQLAIWQNTDNASAAFVPMGWATFGVLLAAALGLLAAAGLAIAKKKPQLPLSPSTLTLLGVMIGLITGCVFVATKPGPTGYVGVGASFWLFGAGAVLGIAAAQMLAKINRPDDPDLMADAMNPDNF